MILSLFRLRPAVVRAVPGLGSALKRAGVRHVELDAVGDLHEIPWCIENGWRIIAIGDSFMRTPGDVERNCKETTVRNSADSLNQSDICDGIEMVDEVKQDPAAYPMARHFVDWWRDESGPPIAWPGHAPQRWEVPELSDENSRQWKWDTCRNGQDRLDRLKGALADARLSDRRLRVMVDTCGWHYRKLVPGTQYQPGKDEPLWGRERVPSLLNIEKQLRMARDAGADIIRLWAIDNPEWAKHRANAPLGSICDTGMGQADERLAGFLEILARFTKPAAAAGSPEATS